MKIALTTRQLHKQLTDLYASENEIRWTRAAIVYAFLESGTVGSTLDFANMKLAGLGSQITVSSYRAAWAAAIQLGFAQHVEPGSEITNLPGINFEEVWAETRSGKRTAKQREQHKVASIQGERDKTSEPKPPRTQSAKENVEIAIRNVEIAIKKEVDDLRRQQLQLALIGLNNALGAYRRKAA